MNRSVLFRAIGISISLGTLPFIRVFRELLYPEGDRFFEYDVPTGEFAAVLVCVAIVAALFVGIQLLEQYAKTDRMKVEVRLLLLGLGLLSFSALSAELVEWAWPKTYERVHFQVPIAVLALCLLIPNGAGSLVEKASNNLKTIALAALPFCLLICLQSVNVWLNIQATDLDPQNIENFRSDSGSALNGRRVVWIIFDELEMGALENRPAHIRTPNLDRLWASSFVAENAYSPTRWTHKSIPSLLIGRPVISAKPAGVDRLHLTFAGDEQSSLGEASTVFDEVKQMGGSSGVVGWYLPYPRLFKESLAAAYWRPDRVRTCRDLWECISDTTAQAMKSLPFGNPLDTKKRSEFEDLFSEASARAQTERHPQLKDHAFELAADTRLDLVFLHLSIPHAPYIGADHLVSESGYFGSLEAVDDTLGELRAEMERNGVWDTTTLIVSSDHWWRQKTAADLGHLASGEKIEQVLADQRIPFIVKLPGDRSSATFTKRFNTVVARHLVEAMLRGEVRTTDQLIAKLEALESEHPSYFDRIPDFDEPHNAPTGGH